jgi:hypothetical protein
MWQVSTATQVPSIRLKAPVLQLMLSAPLEGHRAVASRTKPTPAPVAAVADAGRVEVVLDEGADLLIPTPSLRQTDPLRCGARRRRHRQRAGDPVADRPHDIVLRSPSDRIDSRGVNHIWSAGPSIAAVLTGSRGTAAKGHKPTLKCPPEYIGKAAHGLAGAADVTSLVITLEPASVYGPNEITDRNVGGVALACHQNSAGARLVVMGIECVRVAAEISFEPSSLLVRWTPYTYNSNCG